LRHLTGTLAAPRHVGPVWDDDGEVDHGHEDQEVHIGLLNLSNRNYTARGGRTMVASGPPQ
jgi:hypothetical protein